MASYDEVMSALRNADAAGDEEAATRLAKIASSMKSSGIVTQAPEKAGVGTGIAQAFAGVGNSADTAISMLAGGAASMFGQTDDADKIYQEMEARNKQRMQWANPDNKEVGFGGKALGLAATLPMQMVTSGFSPAETGKGLLDNGESLSTARKGAAISAAGNAAGMLLPGWKEGTALVRAGTGAVANMAQDFLTKKAIQAIADTDKTKKQYEPSVEDSVLAGLLGGATAAAAGKNKSAKRVDPDKSPVQAKLDEIDAARKTVETPVGKETPADYHANEGLDGQRSLWDIPEEGRTPNPYEAVTGDWRIDENGMPIKADLSMDVANAENPLQRNLWGDELPQKHPQENDLNLPQAIDSMPSQPWKGDQRDVALARLQGELPAPGELQGAKFAADLAAEKAAPLGSAARAALMKKQGGMINPKVFQEGFEKVKDMGDGLLLKAIGDKNYLRIFAFKNGEDIGGAVYKPVDKWADPSHTDISSTATGIVPEHRGQGIASEVYRFASELGNDIVPDKVRTEGGKALWSKMEEQGLARDGYIPKGQRGGINIKAIGEALDQGKERINDAVKMAANIRFNHTDAAADYIGKHVPEAGVAMETKFAQPDAPDVTVQKALADGVTDTPSLWNNVQSGPGLAAAKFKNHPVLQSVSRNLNYALKAGDYQVRQLVHPLEKYLSTIPAKDLVDVHDVLRREMFNEARYTPEQLKAAGLTDKQLNAYTMTRKAFDTALDIQNESRLAMGLDPVKPGEAYMSSRWNGDWHIPVTDKDGKLVWYIRTTTKKEGVKALAFLKEKFPELDITDKTAPEYRKNSTNPAAPSDVMGAYHDMLDFFKDRPEVSSQIKSAMEDFMQSKAYTSRGQDKHFLEKANIRGFEGDRPWLTPTENAYDGMKSQISYLNNAIKWSHTQEAIANLKQVLANPEVVAKHPNAVEFSKLTLARELGIDSNWTAGLENAMAKGLGVSRSSIYRGTADMKTMTYLQILGLSPGYMLATPLQAVMTTPSWHQALTSEGFTHNLGKTSLLATIDTTAGIANHISHELGKAVDVPMSKFGREALQYAEDSGIVSKNLFDESQGLGQHTAFAKLKSGMGWTVGFPEKVARMGAFMSFAHHLEASGKYAGDKLALFRHAEELTDNALTSFKSFDRPMIVEKMGAAGQMGYMFKSFLFNGFNQLSTFSRMAHEAIETKGKSGSIKPLLTSVGMYALMGGLAGAPFVHEMDGLWNVIKEQIAKHFPQYYKDVQGKGIKGTLISLLPETSALRDVAAYGLPSAITQTQLASRLNLAAVDVEKPLGSIAPIAQEMKEWGGLGSALLHHNKDAVLSGVYQNMPPLVKGQMETRFPEFKDGDNPGNQGYFKPDDLNNPTLQEHRRTKFDEGIRRLGMTSLPEARDKEAKFLSNQELMRKQEAEKELMTRIVSAVKRKDKEDLKDYSVALFQLNPESKYDLDKRLTDLHLTPSEREVVKMATLNQINIYQRYRSMSK